MCVIKISFAQLCWFHESKVEWNTTYCGNRMGYKKPFILPKVASTCNIPNHTPIYSISLFWSIAVNHHLCSLNMLTNGSPPKPANMAHHGGLFHQQNSFSLLGVSGSVWDLSDQIPRVVNPRVYWANAVAFRWTWEHLGAPTTSLGARRITVEQSGINIKGMLLVNQEIVATTYPTTIFKPHEFSWYSHLCIYGSISLPLYT